MGGVLVIQCLTLVTKTSHVALQVPCFQHILLVLYLSQEYLLSNTDDRPPVTDIFTDTRIVLCILAGNHQYFEET